MRSHIKNMLGLSLILLSSCSSTHQQKQSTNSFPKPKQVLVFQDGATLKAVDFEHSKVLVLRDRFLVGRNGWKYAVNKWSLSPDGNSLAFASAPTNVEFFNAAAWRDYLFNVSFDGKQKVLLAAYGAHADKREFNFDSPSWSADGKRLLVSRQITGNSIEPSEIAIYDASTRRELWNSGMLSLHLPKGRRYMFWSLRYPALSPNGHDVVCLAQEEPNDGSDPEVWEGSKQKVPPVYIVHFNLKSKTSKVLVALDDQFSVGKRYMIDRQNSEVKPGARALIPQFTWHPTQKKFVFVGPVSSKTPALTLFNCDLQTRKVTRFSQSDASSSDFSPQWSLDGKQLFWLCGDSRSGTIYYADANGSNVKAVLPKIGGVSRIQLLPRIPDWSRYRKLSIEPRVGADE